MKKLLLRSFNKDSDQGAIVSKEHFDKILSYINISKEEGCKVLTGGMKVDLNDEYRNGWYIRPTLLKILIMIQELIKKRYLVQL